MYYELDTYHLVEPFVPIQTAKDQDRHHHLPVLKDPVQDLLDVVDTGIVDYLQFFRFE